MLFVSRSQNFACGVIPQKIERNAATGESIITDPGIEAIFTHGGCPEWAIEQALLRFRDPRTNRLPGIADDADERMNISRYDTDKEALEHGWTPEVKEEVETVLLRQVQNLSQYLTVVEEPVNPADIPPWNNYDETHGNAVLNTAKQIGADPEVVLAYERAHKNRPGVVAGLEEWATTPAEQLIEA